MSYSESTVLTSILELAEHVIHLSLFDNSFDDLFHVG